MSAHPRGLDLNPDSVDALPEIRVHPGEGWIAEIEGFSSSSVPRSFVG